MYKEIYSLLLLLILGRRGYGEGGIPASVLPNISNLQQDTEAFINNFRFNLLTQRTTLVTCGDQSQTNSVWQNALYPKAEGGLPGICTLKVTPPAGTCAIKVNFDDLAFTVAFNFMSLLSCNTDRPSFKMSHSAGVTRSLCTDLTGYEGILEIDPANLEPTVLVLQLDPMKTFKFRVNVTFVSCSSIKQYKSPSICGIKNDASVGGFGRSDFVTLNAEKHNHPEDDEQQSLPVRRFEDAHRETRQSLLSKRKTVAENLRKKPDFFSQVLAQRVESGKIKVTPGNTRILGTEAGVGEYPWMVSIERRTEYVSSPINLQSCAGILLDQQHVLTSASCVLSPITATSVTVRGMRALVGEYDVTMTNETLSYNASVSKAIIPLSFNPYLVNNDIAILQLAKPIDYQRTIRPICLPVDYNVFKTEEGIVTGWGYPAGKLLETTVQLYDESVCNSTLNSILTVVALLSGGDISSVKANDYICVQTLNGISPLCYGDLGVPLVRRDQTGAYFLVGISTALSFCGDFTYPNILTRVRSNSSFINIALG